MDSGRSRQQLFYGIRKSDKEIVSIYDIDTEKTGLRCECICPECNGELQACSLNENNRIRYFRHHNKTRDGRDVVNCSVASANETALHRMAKQIIATEKRIFSPSKIISLLEAGIMDLPSWLIEYVEINSPYECDGKMVVAESVALESGANEFIPDVTFKTAKGELFIEILVSHGVDDNKKEKIANHGVATLEIDLSDFLETPVAVHDLAEIIVNDIERKKWIFFPLPEQIRNNAKRYYEGIEEVIEYRKEEANRRRRNEKIANLFMPTNYANQLRVLRSEADFAKALKEQIQYNYWWFDFSKCLENDESVPFFVDIPITGEVIFKCDRRIWQSLIFNRYVYGRKEDNSKIPPVSDIFDSLVNDYKIKVDWDLTYKLQDPLSEEDTIWLRDRVIRNYLDYLETLGFISSDDYSEWKKTLKTKTIVPPKTDAASYLMQAIQNVDAMLPNVDQLISDQMNAYYDMLYERAKKEREEALVKRKAEEEAKMFLKQQSQEKSKQEALERIMQERKSQQERILNFDYENEKGPIYNSQGYRMAKCCICGQIKLAGNMKKINFSNTNTGYCFQCYEKE